MTPSTKQAMLENSKSHIARMVVHESNRRHLELLLQAHRIEEYVRKRDEVLNRAMVHV